MAAYAAMLPDAPPLPPYDRHHLLPVVELDELSTFAGAKKRIYLITRVGHATRYIIAYTVAYDREPERLQALLDRAPQAAQYYSDQPAASIPT